MVSDRESKKLSVSVTCQWCNMPHYIEVFAEEWAKYEAGAHVQDAFPDMDREIREMFISQTCNECWKKIFAKTA
jgi:hypothetical protein